MAVSLDRPLSRVDGSAANARTRVIRPAAGQIRMLLLARPDIVRICAADAWQTERELILPLLDPSPIAEYRGTFAEEQATRLLWRAGFGPRPGDAERLARLGMERAVASLTRPRGVVRLIGAAPHDDHGSPLDPINTWGDDHCWWLDRMVRSDHENYAREMLELFTLGADHGYDQEDVHQNARALTGWTNDWDEEQGPVNFRFEPKLHDFGIKRIFGHRGRFDWRDSCRLAVSHPDHPTFLVRKLWGYFVGADIPKGTAQALQRAYVESGHEIRPLMEAILRHPLFYEGPRLVTPPVVWTAGLLRSSRQTITTTSWAWIASLTGQVLFQPPNVSGWNYAQWLDTSRWAGRLEAVDVALQKHVLSGKT